MKTSTPGKYKYPKLLVKLFAAFLITLSHLACAESKPCKLSIAQAPELRGFRLGMSVEQIQARFPEFPTPPANEFGLAKVIIDPTSEEEVRPKEGLTVVNAARYPELNEVDRIYLSIIDGRVTEIEVFYRNDLKWQSVDEFASKVSESLKINEKWKGSEGHARSIHCEEFFLFAGIKRATSRPDRSEELPFVRLIDVMNSHIPRLREIEKNENTNLKEKERRQIFKP